jgi:hypothetical protein
MLLPPYGFQKRRPLRGYGGRGPHGDGCFAALNTAPKPDAKHAPKTPLAAFRACQTGLFFSRYAHARPRSRTLLTIERYWLFKRRIACAAGGPLELLRNPSGGVMPAALLRLKSLHRCKCRSRALAHNRGQLPPDPKDREGAYMDVAAEPPPTSKQLNTRGLRSLEGVFLRTQLNQRLAGGGLLTQSEQGSAHSG